MGNSRTVNRRDLMLPILFQSTPLREGRLGSGDVLPLCVYNSETTRSRNLV